MAYCPSSSLWVCVCVLNTSPLPTPPPPRPLSSPDFEIFLKLATFGLSPCPNEGAKLCNLGGGRGLGKGKELAKHLPFNGKQEQFLNKTFVFPNDSRMRLMKRVPVFYTRKQVTFLHRSGSLLNLTILWEISPIKNEIDFSGFTPHRICPVRLRSFESFT